MDSGNDEELLRRFVEARDEEAFARIVGRHVDAVYAAARRQVGDAHLAEDVAQAVFIVLARQAKTIRNRAGLAGWLIKVTWYASRDAIKARARRLRLERQAATMQQTSQDAAEVKRAWGEIEPVLDEALARLKDAERTAIVLRFLENRSLGETAAGLGATEAAASKRIGRALAKLRRLLGRRGVMLSVGVLAGALTAASAEAAPVTLSSAAVAAALGPASMAATGTAIGTITKGTIMAMTISKVKVAAVAALLVLAAIPPAVIVIRETMWSSAPPPVVAALPDAVPATEPEGAPLELNPYELAAGQVFKHVVSPPESSRVALLEHLRIGPPGTDNRPQPRPEAIALQVVNAELHQFNWTWEFDRPFHLSMLLEYYLDAYPQEVEGNDANPMIPGDFLCRADSTPEQRRAGLEAILQRDLPQPMGLAFRDVSRKVIVIKGRWKYTPPASPRAKGGEMRAPLIEIYETAISQQTDGMGIGNSRKMAGELGKHLHQQVLFEVDEMPKDLWWCFNDSQDLAPAKASSVLDHLMPQMGLSWSEEIRTVRRLTVEGK